ncbi:hypothetical protein Enr13x_26400 [Stieleria neptunia]|uniref:Uncharacterized protein n=1 Tax=Stieleria neptunia TaxID=2527979 RepID=A0A518HPL6_9BACT|nr:hypothetical protein [Stieleria neptunia]QDV42790.1 hypothetical protein Enr13x_26400 [Stieleria neptunia]
MSGKLSGREDKTSLGVVRPTKVIDLEIRPAEEEWKPKWQALFSQMLLFGPPQKPLLKLPFSFHYVFACKDSEKPHTAMCEDWELGVLFLSEGSSWILVANRSAAAGHK